MSDDYLPPSSDPWAPLVALLMLVVVLTSALILAWWATIT